MQNSLEGTCDRGDRQLWQRSEAGNFIKKETLVQVFSCKFFEIPEKTFFTEHLQTTAFG